MMYVCTHQWQHACIITIVSIITTRLLILIINAIITTTITTIGLSHSRIISKNIITL